jgi:hypothetical protein
LEAFFSIKRGNNRQLIRRLILCFFSLLHGFSFQIDILNYIYVLPTFVWCFFYVNGSSRDKKYINGFFSDFFKASSLLFNKNVVKRSSIYKNVKFIRELANTALECIRQCCIFNSPPDCEPDSHDVWEIMDFSASN